MPQLPSNPSDNGNNGRKENATAGIAKPTKGRTVVQKAKENVEPSNKPEGGGLKDYVGNSKIEKVSTRRVNAGSAATGRLPGQGSIWLGIQGFELGHGRDGCCQASEAHRFAEK